MGEPEVRDTGIDKLFDVRRFNVGVSRSDMVQLRFQFETGAMTLNSGELFSPNRHATNRWEVVIPSVYEIVGSHVELLYQTADNQFIAVTAIVGPSYSYFEDIEAVRLVGHRDARAWLQRYNFMFPDCLMEGIKTFPTVPRKRPKASEPVNEPRPAANPPAVNIGNWDEGGKAFAEAFKAANDGVSTDAKAAMPKPGAKPGDENDEQTPTHAPDFTSVNWFGTRYTFSKGNQCQAVRVLWEAWEQGEHSLSQETIGKRIGSSADRFEMRKTFRQKKRKVCEYEPHSALGTMIQQGSKGCYRLVRPKSD